LTGFGRRAAETDASVTDSGPADASLVQYREDARGYLTSWLLLALLGGGFLLDWGIGGAGAHLVGWLIAALIVVGADALSAHAARELRSISVTSDELLVGANTRISRPDIMAVEREVDPMAPVLGRTPGAGLPRFVPGLMLRLTDGRGVAVPTKQPARLAAALGFQAVPFDQRTTPDVRAARAAELAALPDLEDRSGALFRVAGLDLPPGTTSVEQLRAAREVLVIGEPPVGFAELDELDGQAHLRQLSVLPSHMRRGLGSALLEASCAWAASAGYREIVLTTFADVPWNGPFYRARGFVEMRDPGPGLAAVRAAEKAAGLDEVSPRIAMRRELVPDAR
jgi:GNAT superfamily N-acetyltransferase